MINRVDFGSFGPHDGRIDLVEWLHFAEERLPDMQTELERGELKAVVTARAPVRGEVEGGENIPANPRLQRPFVFDSVPPGNVVPVIGVVKP